jgi:hypothetical protein
MRVKLCTRCPYLPHDLASHYDPEAVLHLCARCDGERWMITSHYPRDSYRRRQCVTNRDVFETTQQRVARSATDTLVSSATTPAKPPSVQRSALTASSPARRATADGYADSRRPDSRCGESHAEISRRSDRRINQLPQADAALFFALGGATCDTSRNDRTPSPSSFSEPCAEPIGASNLREGG